MSEQIPVYDSRGGLSLRYVVGGSGGGVVPPPSSPSSPSIEDIIDRLEALMEDLEKRNADLSLTLARITGPRVPDTFAQSGQPLPDGSGALSTLKTTTEAINAALFQDAVGRFSGKPG